MERTTKLQQSQIGHFSFRFNQFREWEAFKVAFLPMEKAVVKSARG